MPHKITPYFLPIATILVVFLLFIFGKPAITGFFVAPQSPSLNVEVRITADEIIPEDAILHAYLLDNSSNIALELERSNIKEFVAKYNLSLAYKNGKNTQLDYNGNGYIGNAKVNMTNEGIKQLKKGVYSLKIELIYNGAVASSSEQKVVI